MTPPLCVFGFAETALVNQALAKSAPGLGPSGFDPHAFARPGLRAPLAPGQGVWGVTEQKVHLSPAPSRPLLCLWFVQNVGCTFSACTAHFGWGAFYLHVVSHGLGVVGDRTSVNELLARLNPT